MLTALVIILLGLAPSLLWLYFFRRMDARTQARLQLALNSATNRRLAELSRSGSHDYYEGLGFVIGDITCCYNARSQFIRCAVNPLGPCNICRHYDPIQISEQL